jgi:YVTN family beta-propeller protein
MVPERFVQVSLCVRRWTLGNTLPGFLRGQSVFVPSHQVIFSNVRCEMIRRFRLVGAALIAAGFLSACGGTGNVASATRPEISRDSQSAATSPQGALRAAQSADLLLGPLTVAPSSAALTLPTAQTLTVTVAIKTIVFATSSDPRIATVSPSFVTVDTLTAGSGTATFTVTPKEVGKASIELLDVELAHANVPVTVSVPVAASTIYVANFGGASVQMFTTAGELTQTITAGIDTPQGIAVDANGKIYVVNDGYNDLTTYTAQGTQTTPTITGLNSPFGVALDTTGNIYIADPGNTNLTTYNAQGTEITPTISEAGYADPAAVAVDGSGNIYIANGSVSTVTKYNAQGTLTQTISAGVSQDYGVAIGPGGKIYVTNADTNTVTTYDAQGNQTTPTVTTGLNEPEGVAVDAVGNIYVANYGNSTVATYNAAGTLVTTFTVNNPIGCCLRGISVH